MQKFAAPAAARVHGEKDVSHTAKVVQKRKALNWRLLFGIGLSLAFWAAVIFGAITLIR